jgi:predicted DNA-binding transcriptional regulator YafY
MNPPTDHADRMRAGRLLSLVSILGREGRITAAELAERLEVSERTILRDIEVLSGSGVPVYATRGVGGGFQLLEGYPPTLPAEGRLRTGSRRPGLGRMTVRITDEGRRMAAILGHLQPLRPRPEPPEEGGWVTATCRMRSLDSMSVEVLALGPHVEVVAPDELRTHVAELSRRTTRLYDAT